MVQKLEKLGFVYDYLFEPAGQSTCFPKVFVYTTTHGDLSIERAIQFVHESKPRQVRHQHGVITAKHGREPDSPNNPELYNFFLGSGNSSPILTPNRTIFAAYPVDL